MITPVFIRPSPINGLGVFAKRSFRKGERLLEIDDSRIVDEAHPLRPGEEARHCDYLSGGKVVLMRRPERYINHSCDPHSYVKTVSGRRLVIALRDLAEGEEITYDYCINGDGATTWFCHCGAARCRREIHSDFFHLPIDLQLEYLPLLDDWFREERAAELNQLRSRGMFAWVTGDRKRLSIQCQVFGPRSEQPGQVRMQQSRKDSKVARLE